MEHLSGLNEVQKEAVTRTKGPLLIIAGAGTGKTRVITHRMYHLMTEGVLPERICAITFTNKAAEEMRERVYSLMKQHLGTKPEPSQINTNHRLATSNRQLPFVGTFHALAILILRQSGEVLGIPRRFTIFDREDSLSAIKRAMRDLGIDFKEISPTIILSRISRAKSESLTLNEFREQKSMDFINKRVAQVWERYQDALTHEKALDFDDLLLQALLVLRKDPAVLRAWQERFTHIHVDEYQDTNIVQYELARLLAKEHNNICVVGDHDQCIYTWRSADVRNIERFEKDFPDVKVVTLEENYRSTKTILAAANDAIRMNEMRKEKTLFTTKGDGKPIELFVAFNEGDEATWIAERAQGLIEEGVPPTEIAVLYRAHFQSRALEEAFLRLEVAYQVLGVRFFERKEVKDVLAYIHAALHPENSTHLARIINVPARGIGKTTLLKVLSGLEDTLPHGMRCKVDAFKKLLFRIHTFALANAPSKTIQFIVKETELGEILSKGSDDDEERLLNIKELASLAKRFDEIGDSHEESLLAFLENAALQSDQDALKRDVPSVKLMTVHAAKGLEFKHVFITGLEEGLFPSERSAERATPEEREEERRLFYVALTRAEEEAHLSYATVRTLFGSTNMNIPSRFVTEMNEDLVSVVNDQGIDISDRPRRRLLDIDF
ncbi:MAG: UvrD-helicase domain-containing protein [Patescibacteria group bacterium]